MSVLQQRTGEGSVGALVKCAINVIVEFSKYRNVHVFSLLASVTSRKFILSSFLPALNRC